MGLTIHYRLTTSLSNPKDVRHLVEGIRQFALELALKEVWDVREFKGEAANYRGTTNETERWLKIQASGHVRDGERSYTIQPQHVIAFSSWPGEGCEAANFGFSRYPAFVNVDGVGRRRRLTTKLTGWQWSSFCKTQYASDPACGGVENFLRCHLCVVKMLDFIQQTGMATVEVRDEGEYWERRDVKALAQEVGEWNEFVAGLSIVLRTEAEARGTKLEATITGFQNFEHLEAKGLEKLTDLQRRLGNPTPISDGAIMNDPTEAIRRAKLVEINAEPGSREALETAYGQVWDTKQLGEDFEVIGFQAPFVVVWRKADGVKGSLEFQHSPRFYYSFRPDR